MSFSHTSPYRRISEAARMAALAARKAKREGPNTFGLPELFIVRTADNSFTWELRRFGGVLLERGIEAFRSEALARADGEAVLATLRASPDLPTLKRHGPCRIEPAAVRREAEGAEADPFDDAMRAAVTGSMDALKAEAGALAEAEVQLGKAARKG